MSGAHGECIVEDFKLEYLILSLTYIDKKYLHIEAVCHNPAHLLDKEAVFKYTTSVFNHSDKKLMIAMSIINDIILKLNITKKVFKLIINDGKIFYLYSIK